MVRKIHIGINLRLDKKKPTSKKQRKAKCMFINFIKSEKVLNLDNYDVLKILRNDDVYNVVAIRYCDRIRSSLTYRGSDVKSEGSVKYTIKSFDTIWDARPFYEEVRNAWLSGEKVFVLDA